MSNRIAVTSRVKIYALDGEELYFAKPLELVVESDRIYNERLVLVGLDERRLTVVARDLEAAIQNATNAK